MLSSVIGMVTNERYNHISLSLDKELNKVYSFGRKKPNNPLIGGFVKEDTTSDFLSRASCQVFELEVTDEQYEQIEKNIHFFENHMDLYSYNSLGLIPAALNIPLVRPHNFFCSEFVSHILIETGVMERVKEPSIMTPQDVVEYLDMVLIYEGTIYEYKKLAKGRSLPRRIMHSVYHFVHYLG